MFQFVKIIGRCHEKVVARGPAIFSANYLDKRNAGHSEAANRKEVKQATNNRKSKILEKLRKDIYKEIKSSRKANTETNPRLQAILNEAHKASIPTDSLQKYIKTLESFINNENVESYVFQHTLGIVYIIEMSEINSRKSKTEATSIMKRFGFKFIGLGNEMFKLYGVISCKPLENVTKNLDKALEDAISANCEDVLQKDDGNFEFICHESGLDKCKKILEDIGYEINNAEKKYAFPDYIKVNESVLEKLDKIQEKFETTDGFLGLSHNIEK